MHFNKVTISNYKLLTDFLNLMEDEKKSFRYFNKRSPEVISNHLYTCVATESSNPCAYGHLDVEDNKVWLGIAVLKAFQGKGFGSQMMDHLIQTARQKDVKEIHLSVDNDNASAINLYVSKGFKEVLRKDHFILFGLPLAS